MGPSGHRSVPRSRPRSSRVPHHLSGELPHRSQPYPVREECDGQAGEGSGHLVVLLVQLLRRFMKWIRNEQKSCRGGQGGSSLVLGPPSFRLGVVCHPMVVSGTRTVCKIGWFFKRGSGPPQPGGRPLRPRSAQAQGSAPTGDHQIDSGTGWTSSALWPARSWTRWTASAEGPWERQ